MNRKSKQETSAHWRELRDAVASLKKVQAQASEPVECALLECAVSAAEKALDSLVHHKRGRAKTHADVPAARPKLPAQPTEPLSFLIVEDNVVTQRVLDLMLLKAGHTATIVDNGRDAIGMIEQHSFDVVLLDLMLPDVSGIETLETIRAIEVIKERRTPIVALTSLEIGEVPLGEWIGLLDAYLMKPLNARQFHEVIGRVVSRRQLMWLAEMPMRMNDDAFDDDEPLLPNM